MLEHDMFMAFVMMATMNSLRGMEAMSIYSHCMGTWRK